MSDVTRPFDGSLIISPNIDYFRNGEEFYVYHNLFGYILKMSEDVVEFLEFFRGEPKDSNAALEAFVGRFSDDMIGEFANVLALQNCLESPDESEEPRLLGMYPMHARWIVVHQPASGPVTVYALDQQSKSHVLVAELDDWDSRLWRTIDGETTVQEIIEKMRSVPGSPVSGIKERVFATLAQLTHCDLQALKMSTKPASTYKFRRHGTPPYLISTMPYERITSVIVGGEGPHVAPSGIQREPIDEALLARDLFENRFSQLFRAPHAALQGLSYGGRIADLLASDGALSAAPRILEVSADDGTFARCLLDRLQETDPTRYAATRYVLATPDEHQAGLQRETLAAYPVDVRVIAPQELAAELADLEEPFDLVLCDEFIANLDVVAVRKLSPNADEDEDDDDEASDDSTNGKQTKRDTFIGEGDAVHMIFKHGLVLNDAPEDFFLNVGAFRLLEQLAKVMASPSRGYVIEFGEQYHYPVRTVDEMGIAFSVHFGHLIQVAKRLGLETEFGFLMDELTFERDMAMLSSTRSQFKALRHLFARLGHTLERKAYNADEFQALLVQVGIGEGELIEIVYEPMEERVLGLVTPSMKLLRLSKA